MRSLRLNCFRRLEKLVVQWFNHYILTNGMVEIVRTKTGNSYSDFPKKEIVHMKTTINPNDKKSNYFLFRKVEPFPHYLTNHQICQLLLFRQSI